MEEETYQSVFNVPRGQGLREQDRTTLQLWNHLSTKFSMMPLKVKSKEPVESGWQRWCTEKRQHVAEDYHEHDEHWNLILKNAAVLAGPASGIIVLDIDNVDAFEAWRKSLNLPSPPRNTFHVKTKKGFHLYYQYPMDGREYRRRSENGVFDILALGSYVVAPGSIHPSGVPYELIADHPIQPAPEWVLRMALGLDPVESIAKEPTDAPEADPIEPDASFISSLPVSNRIRGSKTQQPQPVITL